MTVIVQHHSPKCDTALLCLANFRFLFISLKNLNMRNFLGDKKERLKKQSFPRSLQRKERKKKGRAEKKKGERKILCLLPTICRLHFFSDAVRSPRAWAENPSRWELRDKQHHLRSAYCLQSKLGLQVTHVSTNLSAVLHRRDYPYFTKEDTGERGCKNCPNRQSWEMVKIVFIPLLQVEALSKSRIIPVCTNCCIIRQARKTSLCIFLVHHKTKYK